MEAVIILRRQSEYSQCAILVPCSIFWIGITQQSLDRELTTLHPDAGGIAHAIEDDGATICRRDHNLWLIRARARAGVGLQSAVEELVEVTEFVKRQKNLGHVQLMEIDEILDLASRGGIVILSALFDTQRL
jgi:hypothetical protein